MPDKFTAAMFTIEIDYFGSYVIKSYSKEGIDQEDLRNVADKIHNFLKKNVDVSELIPKHFTESAGRKRITH